MFIHANSNIYVFDEEPIKHTKASETYIHVKFTYPSVDEEMDLWIPVEYRRLGFFIDSHNENELSSHLDYVYEHLNPELLPSWMSAQKEFWDTKPRADITKEFFDNLIPGKWVCVNCDLPSNPNFARRIQDIKEFGYTIVTDTNRVCEGCGKKTTHLLLLPLRVAEKVMAMKPGHLDCVRRSSMFFARLMYTKIPPLPTACRIINSLKFAGMRRQKKKTLMT